MRLVLDCSVAPGFVFPEEHTVYTETVRMWKVTKQGTFLVPPLFHTEIANVLRMQERRGRWTAKEIEDCLLTLAMLKPSTVPIVISLKEAPALIELSRKHDLTAYDATYLLLALQEGAQLATQDKALAEAAKKEGCYFEG